jgi:hypothetical protein
MVIQAVLLLLSVGAEPRYDPATVIDLPVVVTEVRAAAGEYGLDGLRLTARTEADATIDVYLGPSSFLKEFEIVFSKGDRIQIIGSKVKVAGGFLVLAREVRKGSATLYLRGKTGEPYWPSGH